LLRARVEFARMVERCVQLGDGREIWLSSSGPEDGSPVVYLHGCPGSRLDDSPGRDAILDRLRVRAITVERPGYGRSSPCRGRRVVDYVEDLRAVADHAQIDRFALLGYSAGGPYAMAAAARLGERVTAVATISSVGRPGWPGALEGMARGERTLHRLIGLSPRLVQLYFAFAKRLAARDPERFLREFEKELSDTDRELYARPEIREQVLRAAREGLRQGAAGAAEDWAEFARRPWGFDPTELDRPVHLWFATADRIVPVAQGRHLASLLPDPVVHEIVGEGHLLPFAHLEDVLSALMAPSLPGESLA
jgi:pimeloyl-ACP methyl ester carboxylesterase